MRELVGSVWLFVKRVMAGAVVGVTISDRAPPPVLGIWPSKRKLNEENSKHGSSAQQNGFGPTFSHRMLLRLVKGTAEPAVDWLDNLIGRGLAVLQPCMGDPWSPLYILGGNEPFGYLKADLLYLDKLSLRNYNNFVRGDVVVFRSPLEPKMWLVKRLIALQGDWVTVPGTYEILQVPKGHCWVEGDNAEVSLDSKSFGPIPLALLKGRVTNVIWPPSRFGRVESHLPEGRVLSQNRGMRP